MYICVTHVDSRTKIPGNKAPMKNGPTFPDVKGLNIEWWDASRWPLTHPDSFPNFYGTCDDDAVTDIPGVIFVFKDREEETEEGTVTVTDEELYNKLKAQEMRARLPQEASPVKIRLALLELDLLDQVNTYFDSLDAATRAKVDIIWEFADFIPKDHPVVQNMAETLKWTEEQLDNVFIKANEVSDNPFAVEEETPE